MWSSWPCVSTIASMSSRRSAMYSKSGRIRSTPGWWSSGKRTPQSMTSRRPFVSRTAMLRPTSPSPPSATTRRPLSGSAGGVVSSGWGWLTGVLSFGGAAGPVGGSGQRWWGRSSDRRDAGAHEGGLLLVGGHERQPDRGRVDEALHDEPGLGHDGALRDVHDGVDERRQAAVH